MATKPIEIPRIAVILGLITITATLVTNLKDILKPVTDISTYKATLENKINMIAMAEAATSADLVAHKKEDTEAQKQLQYTLGTIVQGISDIKETNKAMWTAIKEKNKGTVSGNAEPIVGYIRNN